MAVGVEGHAFVTWSERRTEVRGTPINTPIVTPLVTTSVTRNKEAGVERSITDQQLVGVIAVHGSKTVPQSIGVSTLPIVSCGLYRLVGFSFEVGLVSSLVVDEDYFCELIQKENEITNKSVQIIFSTVHLFS